jgi:hypothetical protein
MKYLLKFYLFKKFEFIYSREQLNRDVKMQPTYEELFAQNQILIRQLKEAQKGHSCDRGGLVILTDRHSCEENETAKRVILCDRGVGYSL